MLLASACGATPGPPPSATGAALEGADAAPRVVSTPFLEPAEGAGNAARRQLTELFGGRAGQEWDELEPSEQAIVSRSQFEQCAALSALPPIQSIALESEYDTTINIAAVPEHSGRSVTVEIMVGPGIARRMLQEVVVAGRWRWVMDDQTIAAYQSGECPA